MATSWIFMFVCVCVAQVSMSSPCYSWIFMCIFGFVLDITIDQTEPIVFLQY